MRRRNAYAFGFVVLAAQAASAADTGMPQMDPTWYLNQLFWLAISFATLYVIVATFVAPKVGGVLAARANAVNEAIATAEELKATAANARGNYEQAGLDARSKAAALIAEAQAANAREAAEAIARLDAELAGKVRAAEEAVKTATAQAQAGLQTSAADLAHAMSEKLLGGNVDRDHADTAVAPLLKAS